MENAFHNKPCNPVSLLRMILLLVFNYLVITLKIIFSNLKCLLQIILVFPSSAQTAEKKHPSAAVSAQKDAAGEEEDLSRVDVEMVMERLGILLEGDDGIRERVGSDVITAMFEEQEPSLEEVREAFDVFDENRDGFIDAKELERLLRALCVDAVSGAECGRMIGAADCNGDERVDFNEFVKLLWGLLMGKTKRLGSHCS